MKIEEGERGPRECECVIVVMVRKNTAPCEMAEYTGQAGGPGLPTPSKEECENQATDEGCWIVCAGKTADTGTNNNFPGKKPDPGEIKEIRVNQRPQCNCNPSRCGGEANCFACRKGAEEVYKELTRPFSKAKTRYENALRKLRCRPLALCQCN
jgi:hypothetical protein